MSWRVHAVKYTDRNARTRRESINSDDIHDVLLVIDYYTWALRRSDEVILINTGYDEKEALHSNCPMRLNPNEALAPLGLVPDDITMITVAHLHYDHAGGLHLFSNAALHLQVAEMAYATGAYMCHDTLRVPFTADHIREAVQRVYSGRLVFHGGDGRLADGVTVHCIGGHSREQQAVSVKTEVGWLCLASDPAHYYENFLLGKPFPTDVSLENMLPGFDRLLNWASEPVLVVPGHDPLVRTHFLQDGLNFVFRPDWGPHKGFEL